MRVNILTWPGPISFLVETRQIISKEKQRNYCTSSTIKRLYRDTICIASISQYFIYMNLVGIIIANLKPYCVKATLQEEQTFEVHSKSQIWLRDRVICMEALFLTLNGHRTKVKFASPLVNLLTNVMLLPKYVYL
jgi:hypothetical protein